MKTRLWIPGLLLLAMLLVSSQAAAQSEELVIDAGEAIVLACAGDQLVLRPVDATRVRVVCNQKPTPAPTEIPPTEIPPATAVPPTEVPTEVPPNTPTTVPPTPTPPAGPVAPFAGAPLCPSHDPYQWHSLWDAARGCHYDHTHNENPARGNAVFGLAAPWGTTISYPWATSAMENTHKHGGYKYAVRLNRPCDPNVRSENNEDYANCVKDLRVQYHAIGHAMDALARFHSFYLEYNICERPAFTRCGIIRYGGWMDFGILEIPYKDHRVVRPGGQIDFGPGSTYGAENQHIVMDFAPDAAELNGQSIHDAPYVSLDTLAQVGYYNQFMQDDRIRGQMEVWSSGDQSHHRYGHNRWAAFTFRIWDSWGLMSETNANQLHWFCRDGSCIYNASVHSVNEVTAFIPTMWDPDGDGLANFKGYTDRYGAIVGGCSAPALDCVPLEVINVPVGYANTIDPGNGQNAAVNYDINPGGVRWIRFPN